MATAIVRKTKAKRDPYMDLVARFPLKTIKNDTEHRQACSMVSELMGRDLESGAGDYLDALLVMINKYEDENHAISEDMTPREALRALMDANRFSQADVGRIIGSETAVSMFLRGDRGLSKKQIKKLADTFKLDAAVFMD